MAIQALPRARPVLEAPPVGQGVVAALAQLAPRGVLRRVDQLVLGERAGRVALQTHAQTEP